MREELERVKSEYKAREEALREQLMVVPRARAKRPGGTEIEEYDLHPRLKYIEKQSDFTFGQLGPAILQEIRMARADISSGINRLVSMFEAVLLPEFKKRAPLTAEKIQERVKKLVGTLTPEQRERELSELEKRVEELAESEEGEKSGGAVTPITYTK